MSNYKHDRIWLQELGSDTSWCSDKIDDDDLEYVRADKVAKLEADNESLKLCVKHDAKTIDAKNREIAELEKTIEFLQDGVFECIDGMSRTGREMLELDNEEKS